MPPITRPRGTNDLLPGESSVWQWLHAVHADVAEAHGYAFADSPVFESTELFERGMGTGTDVVEKEMFTFTDRGGRSLTLRPEGTAGILRAVMAGNVLEQRRPARVHYAGPMFRYDRPQKGRYHQFFQVGVECIGETSPALDVEVIEMGRRFLAEIGLAGVVLQVNTLGDREDRIRYRDALVGYYEPLQDGLCADCRRRLRINPLRLLDCKRDAGLAARAPVITDSLGAGSSAYFAEVQRGLAGAGVAAVHNPRLVRGLDYYVHTSFEYWHESLQGAQNALGGGGRYDGLAEELGFGAAPGVGYALGVERLLLVAAEQGASPPPKPPADVVVCSVTSEEAWAAAATARRLRRDGLRAVLDAGGRRIDRKLRAADRLGAPVCVIVGEDEAREAAVTVKAMRRRDEQRRVPEDEAAAAVRAVMEEVDVTPPDAVAHGAAP